MVASLVLSSLGVLLASPSPAGAQATRRPMVTQQVAVEDPDGVSAVTGGPVSLAGDGRSIGWVQRYGTYQNDRYWVLDRQGLVPLAPAQKELLSPALATEADGASALSGDGRTFVATYAVSSSAALGACSRDGGDAAVGIQYWHQQVIRWERPTRFGAFDDPTLISASTEPASVGCNATAPSADNPTGPPMMGRGAGGPSQAPSVSDDGTVVAFTSEATDLGFSPTEPGVHGLYVWTEGSGLELVSPLGLDDDVEDPSVSGDGDSIVFSSRASNVTGSPTEPGIDYVYVARRPNSPGPWTIELVSKSAMGDLPMAGGVPVPSYSPAIDDDGSRVAFLTRAGNLDADLSDPDYGNEALVVRDLVSEDTRAVVFGNATDVHYSGYFGGAPALSGDGQRVVMWSWWYDASFRGNLPDDRLQLYDVDLALSDDTDERAAARLAVLAYERYANEERRVAISRSDDPPAAEEDTLVAFPAAWAPLQRYRGDPGALYLVGGGEIGPDISRGWHGDPVDTATGNFRQDEVDLVAPPGAGPASLTRSYTSRGDAGGVFGPGWMSPLDVRIEARAEGTVELLEANGQRVVFAVDDNLHWAPVGPDRLSLEEDDGWILTGPDGSVRRFDEEGRLVGVEEPGAPAVEIEWDGGLVSVASSSGYEVTFVDDTSYSDSVPGSGADGFPDAAVSSDGRRVDFAYRGDSWDGLVLASASRPHAVGQSPGTYGVRSYETQGTLITGIVDAVDGTRTRTVVENTYDQWGRVVHQVTDTGDELVFAYGLRPDGLGGMLDAPGFTTVTNDASGDVTVYEYNVVGEVVAITDALGSAVAREWVGDQPAASASRGGVETLHAYDDAGRLTSVVETDGVESRTIETLTYVVADTDPSARVDDRVETRTDEVGVTTTFTYDGASRWPETVSVPCDPVSTDVATPCPLSGLATTTYTYFWGSLEGLVESVTDPDGVVTEYAYDQDRTLASTTVFDGVTPLETTFETLRVGDVGWAETNPAAVEVRTSETPGGAVTAEVFDAEGRVIESRGPLFDGVTHLATVYAYRLDGELASVTDPAGETTVYEVDRVGDPGWAEDPGIAEVRTVTGPDGISTVTKTDRSGDVVVEQRGDLGIPSEVATTTHVYGPLGRLESTTDPMGVETRYAYDVEGRVTEVIDEDDETVETTYDSFGRVTVETDQLGHDTTTTYGPTGLVEEVEDRTGESTFYVYDDLGRLLSTTDARSGVSSRTYTPGGRLASETDATGRTTSYTYDSAGRLATTELPSGADTTFGYDEDGRLVTETSPEGRITTTTYDLAGNVLSVDDPATGLTTSTYTPRGDLHTRTDATSGVITWGYDEVGRVTSVLDAVGEETTYAYDSRGNRVLRVDALDGEREWHYDLADRLTKEIDPLDRETTYTYDDLGRLSVRTDGAGRTETYGYDAAGQVTSLSYASGAPTTFEYDEEGRRTKMVDAYGTTVWHYNATGQMTGADNPGDRDPAWAWDLAGRRTVITYPGGVQYRNRYDLDGNLEEVERNDAGTWVDVAVNDYDDDGNLIAQDQPGGIDRTWTLDPVTGLPTSYVEDDGTTTRTTTVTHDAAGRMLTQAIGGVTTTYDYDDAGQLVDVDRSTGPDESYAYDELGRRETSVVGGITTTYLWDAASQMTRRTIGGVNHNYQYDASGRRTREAWNGGTDVMQWFWGARGNLTGQRSTSPAQVIDIARTTRGNGTLASQTTTINSTPVDTTDVVWDETLPVPQPVWTGQRNQTNETLAIYGPDLIRVDCPAGTNCTGPVAHDIFGSAQETPGTQTVTQASTYDPWGTNTGPFTVGTAYGYRSELHTGSLIHLRNRDYDPNSGTFLSPDPLDGIDGTTTVNNPYHYTDNDPVNRIDPLGLRPCDRPEGCGNQTASGTIPIDCALLVSSGPSIQRARQSYIDAVAGAMYGCTAKILSPMTMGPFWTGLSRSGPYTDSFDLGIIAVRAPQGPANDGWDLARTIYAAPGNPSPGLYKGAPRAISQPINSRAAASYASLTLIGSVTATAAMEARVVSSYTYLSHSRHLDRILDPYRADLSRFLGSDDVLISYKGPAQAECRQWNVLTTAILPVSWRYSWHRCWP